MILAPTDAVLNLGRAFIGVAEQGGPNAGQIVEMFLRLVGLKRGDPWCAAAVSWIGVAALGKQWPIVKTGSCALLGEWAQERNLLLTDPQPGDVVLYYHAALGRFAHTGFVEFVFGGGKLAALEGNTNDDGGREGWKYLRKTRTLGPRDRVIRWTGALT